jgi:hypothetical protein
MNFIDPFKGNYQNLFLSLIKMPAILKGKDIFRYEFADSTKRQIISFVTIEKGRIKDYINNSRLV